MKKLLILLLFSFNIMAAWPTKDITIKWKK